MLTLLSMLLPLAFSQEFTVAPQIQEVSGAAWDSSRQIMWSIGDSGTGAKLGITSLKDFTTHAIEVLDAENVDWEAITLSESGELWILDFGDNLKARQTLTAYALDPDEAALGVARAHRKIEWSYPSGPMDVEGGVAKGNEIHVFEKTTFGKVRIHSIDISSSAPAVQLARHRATIARMGQVTDAAFDPSGMLYLLTYNGIFSCDGCLSGRAAKPIKLGFWGQAETLIALGDGRFLVADESGRFRSP